MKTLMIKNTEVKRAWHLIDAQGQILGRVSTEIASLLKGKHKVNITPHVDCGDGVIVINCEKIKVTGNKLEEKRYKRYSGYPSGLKEEPMGRLLGRRPADIIRHAVKGMLPKTKLGAKMLKRLKVYAGDKHPHIGQHRTAKVKKEGK